MVINDTRNVLSLNINAANEELNELDALLGVLLMATEDQLAVHGTLMQCRRKVRRLERIAGAGAPAEMRLVCPGERAQHALA